MPAIRYVRSSGRALAQNLAQDRDVPRQIAFLNEGPWPDFLEQLLFSDRVPMVLHQHQKDFQVLGFKPQAPTFTQQNTFVRVQAETVKFVHMSRFHAISRGKVFSGKSEEILKGTPDRLKFNMRSEVKP